MYLLNINIIINIRIFKGSIAEIKINTKMLVKAYLFNKQFKFSLDETRMR